MTLFDVSSGHLTKEALEAWAEGGLCTEQRLLVAEHLAECDDCLIRMTEVAEDGPPILLPKKDLVGPAVQRVKERRILDVFKRCGVAAAAAGFAFLMWRFEWFCVPEAELQPQITQPTSMQLFAAQLSDDLFAWGADLSATLQDTFTRNDLEERTQRSGDHV